MRLNETKRLVRELAAEAASRDHQVIEINFPTVHMLRLFASIADRRLGSTMTNSNVHGHIVAYGNDEGIYLQAVNMDTKEGKRDGGGFHIFFPRAMVSDYRPFHLVAEVPVTMRMEEWGKTRSTLLVVGESILGLLGKNIPAVLLKGVPDSIETLKTGYLNTRFGYLDTSKRWVIWGWVDQDNFGSIDVSRQKRQFWGGRTPAINYYLGQRTAPFAEMSVINNIRIKAPTFQKLWKRAGSSYKRDQMKGALMCAFDSNRVMFTGMDYGGTQTLEQGRHVSKNQVIGVGVESEGGLTKIAVPFEFYHDLLFRMRDEMMDGNIDDAYIDLGRHSWLSRPYVALGISDGPRKGFYCCVRFNPLGFDTEFDLDNESLRPLDTLSLWPTVQEPPKHTILTAGEYDMNQEEKDMVAAWFNEWLAAKIRSGGDVSPENEELAKRLGLLAGN